jgi:MFS family permease
MMSLSARLSIGFSWVGHAYMHILVALYLTVVLGLEQSWHLSYDELIRLWTLGSAMVGVGAPLAGWLGDRWSDCRMMVVFFLLTGGGAIAAGLADEPTALTLGLAVLGLGASIYHPVGMSWLVKNAVNPGQSLAWQGVMGSVGVASAAGIAGTLTDWFSWRAAFLVPGAISVATGLALAGCIAAGLVVDRKADLKPQPPASRGDVLRAFIVMSITMLCGGLIWNAMQVAVPKWFDERLALLVGDSTGGIGSLVSLVYLAGALPQLAGGRLADRLSPRTLYVLCLLSQVPLMALSAMASGPWVLVLGVAVITTLNMQIPVENVLLTRFTPGRYRGLAFGAKFILTFGIGPLAVQLVAAVYRSTGTFSLLFAILAGLAGLAFLAALSLPGKRVAVEPA